MAAAGATTKARRARTSASCSTTTGSTTKTEATLRRNSRRCSLATVRWPWFPGGPGNDYITLYITTGFGRLRHLGVDIDAVAGAIRSLKRLDDWMTEHYRANPEALEQPRNTSPARPTRSIFMAAAFSSRTGRSRQHHREAVEFLPRPGAQVLAQDANRQSQGHLAIALKRFNSANLFNDSTIPPTS